MPASPVAVDEVLRRAVQHCASVLRCTDAMLYSWDAGRDRLVARASTVAHRGYERAIELSLGEGVVGWTALNGEVVLIDDFPTDDVRFRVVAGIDEANHRSFLAIPLSTFGVLVARHPDPGRFTAEDVESLEVICLLMQGLLAKEATPERGALTGAVHRIASIATAEDIALTKVPALVARELAHGSGADLVVVVAASITGRPYLEIRGFGVGRTGDSFTLHGQQIATEAVAAAISVHGPLHCDDAPRLFDSLGVDAASLTSVTAHPLEARGSKLGTVLTYTSEFVSGRDETSERLAELIPHASITLALAELTAQPTNRVTERRLIELLVSSQTQPMLVRQLAKEIGIDLGGPVCLLVGHPDDAAEPRLVRQQLHTIEMALRRELPGVVCEVKSDSVRAIAVLAGSTPSDLAKRMAHRLAVQDAGHVGVSDAVGHEHYRRGLNEATSAARVSARIPGSARAVAISDTGPHQYLLALADTQSPTLLEFRLAALRADDPDLYQTVATYVRNACRPSPTARALHLHRNSLASRLRAASATLGTPIDGTTRLTLELAINLVELRT